MAAGGGLALITASRKELSLCECILGDWESLCFSFVLFCACSRRVLGQVGAGLDSLAFKYLVCEISMAKLEWRKTLRVTAATVSSNTSRSFVVLSIVSTWFSVLSGGICLIASGITIQESALAPYTRTTMCVVTPPPPPCLPGMLKHRGFRVSNLLNLHWARILLGLDDMGEDRRFGLYVFGITSHLKPSMLPFLETSPSP